MSFSSLFSPNHMITVSLFKDVTNMKDLKQCLMDGSINATALKPNLIVDRFHVLAAANKALYAHLHGKQVTKTLHSEVLYSLSPSKNISDCFRRFGIGDKDTSLIIVEISESSQSKMDEIKAQIKGEEVALDSLSEMTDTKEVQKVYKVKDVELTVGTLSEAVVARMATKEFISF